MAIAARLALRSFRALGTATRFGSSASQPAAAAGLGVTGRIPDDFEQATGLERKELDEIAKGNTDPFGLSGAKVGAFGTREAPRAIPSHFQSRIIGCCCEEDSELIRFFEVHAGEPTLCPCSRKQYFKLVSGGGDGIESADH